MENKFTLDQSSDLFPAVPWTPRDVAWGLAALILGGSMLLLLAATLQRLGLEIDPSLVIVFGTMLLLIPVWYFTIFKYHMSWESLGLRPFHLKMVGLGCGLMFISMLFNLIYAAILSIFGKQIQPDISPIFAETRFPWLILFGGAVVAPIVEEIFFRGFVFAGLRTGWDWKKAALASAGLFALAHVALTSLLPIFILGLIFAFLYHISGSIWPAIFMHMLTNSLALSAAYAISQGWVS
jgi:membrane protease YdiL (CAAX protease family)